MGPKKMRSTHVPNPSIGQRRKRGAPESNNEFGIIFKDSRQEERYEKLIHRKIVTTRYVDYVALNTLDLEDNVRELFKNVGWEKFMACDFRAYKGLTLEFLSSLQFHEDKTSVTPAHSMSFRLSNVDYQMSLDQLCELFELENNGAVHDSRNHVNMPIGFSAKEFWYEITGLKDYEARTAKASSIHNPVFRYIQRVMAYTLFARGEGGGIRVGELFFLWSMVHNKAANTGFYLMRNMASIAAADTGGIAIGGIITAIASCVTHFDTFPDTDCVKGNIKLDLDFLTKSHMIKSTNRRVPGGYRLLINEQESIRLPDEAKTNVHNHDNWLYGGYFAGMRDEGIELPQQQQNVPRADDHPSSSNQFWQEWCTRVEGEQLRQGSELLLLRENQDKQTEEMRFIREGLLSQNQELSNLTNMMQELLNHFNPQQQPNQP